MRGILLAVLGLGLVATVFTAPAQAVGGCTPATPVGQVCGFADRCHTLVSEGYCAGVFTPVGGARATCQRGDGFGFCAAGAGVRAAGHGAGVEGRCVAAEGHGAGCGAGAGADGSPVGGAGAHASREGASAGARTPAGGAAAGASARGACAGVFIVPAGQGAFQCVPFPHP